jgi:hypothetical protein
MASVSAIGPVQTAIYGLLSADATLLTLATGGVHNDIPDGQAFPHVLISQPTETSQNTFGGPLIGIGRRVIARVHVFSRYQGDAEVTAILSRIVALLDFQVSSVSGFTSAMCEYEQGRILVEAKDRIETRHAVGEFCVTVQQ